MTKTIAADPPARWLRWLAALAIAVVTISPVTTSAQNPCADGGSLLLGMDEADGIGGTGHAPSQGDDGGIGGTGLAPGDGDDEGGIGGTGLELVGDTGIVGTVTGFASVCVGNSEIHYGPDTRVTIDGVGARVGSLAVGNVVEVVASSAGDRLTATSIALRHEVSGPVSAVDRDGRRMTVAGQIVEVASSTWTTVDGTPGRADLGAIEIGDIVRVAGLRREDGAIVASRVDAVAADAPALLTGTVSEVGEGMLMVHGTEVHAAAAGTARFAVGQRVRVAGGWRGASIDATRVELLSKIPFGGRVKRLKIEGIVFAGRDGHALRVGGVEFAVREASLAESVRTARPGDRVRVDATVHGRSVVADRVSPIRPRLPRDTLRDQRRPRLGRGRDPMDGPGTGGSAGRARGPGVSTGPQGQSARPVRPERQHRGKRPERAQRPERPQRADRPQRPERPERPPRPERPIGPVRPDRPPRPDRPSRPERPETPPRI